MHLCKGCRMMPTLCVVAFGLLLTAPSQTMGTESAGSSQCLSLVKELNAECCNGGIGAGHRRTQAAGCKLDTCSAGCAAAFGRVVASCQSKLPVQAILSQVKGFHAKCQAAHGRPKSQRQWVTVQGQFLAGDPGMPSTALSKGTGAKSWGIWRNDPGPRGVMLSSSQALEKSGMAPAGWVFNRNEWWLEEHGLIMEIPAPLPAGKYKILWLNYRAGYHQEVRAPTSSVRYRS